MVVLEQGGDGGISDQLVQGSLNGVLHTDDFLPESLEFGVASLAKDSGGLRALHGIIAETLWGKQGFHASRQPRGVLARACTQLASRARLETASAQSLSSCRSKPSPRGGLYRFTDIDQASCGHAISEFLQGLEFFDSPERLPTGLCRWKELPTTREFLTPQAACVGRQGLEHLGPVAERIGFSARGGLFVPAAGVKDVVLLLACFSFLSWCSSVPQVRPQRD